MKRIFSILLYLSLLIIIVGCGHIEDTNGESTKLTTITLETLSGKNFSSTYSGISTKSKRSNITINTANEEYDIDELLMTGGKISGICKIMVTELNEGDTFKVYAYSIVQEGNLQMILISPTNKILYEFTTGVEDSCLITAKESGEYEVRIGSESFSGEIRVVRSIN